MLITRLSSHVQNKDETRSTTLLPTLRQMDKWVFTTFFQFTLSYMKQIYWALIRASQVGNHLPHCLTPLPFPSSLSPVNNEFPKPSLESSGHRCSCDLHFFPGMSLNFGSINLIYQRHWPQSLFLVNKFSDSQETYDLWEDRGCRKRFTLNCKFFTVLDF